MWFERCLKEAHYSQPIISILNTADWQIPSVILQIQSVILQIQSGNVV